MDNIYDRVKKDVPYREDPVSRCSKCGHADSNPMGKCTEEVVEKNVEVTGLDGKKYIEPEMYDICACKEPVHYEHVPGFPDDLRG